MSKSTKAANAAEAFRELKHVIVKHGHVSLIMYVQALEERRDWLHAKCLLAEDAKKPVNPHIFAELQANRVAIELFQTAAEYEAQVPK